MPTTQELLQQLQAALPGLQNTYNLALAAWQAVQVELDKARAASQECQAKRDAENLSWKKNQACSLATRDSLLAAWDKLDKEAQSKKTVVDTAKAALDGANEQIAKVIAQGQAALNLDPTFNLAQQAQNQQQQNEQKKTEEEQKSKRMLYTVIGIVGGLAAVVGLLFALGSRKKAKA